MLIPMVAEPVRLGSTLIVAGPVRIRTAAEQVSLW
jgi:hypothetical protein